MNELSPNSLENTIKSFYLWKNHMVSTRKGRWPKGLELGFVQVILVPPTLSQLFYMINYNKLSVIFVLTNHFLLLLFHLTTSHIGLKFVWIEEGGNGNSGKALNVSISSFISSIVIHVKFIYKLVKSWLAFLLFFF